MINEISTEDLFTLLKTSPKNTLFIDTRTPKEFQSVHVDGFQNIPLEALSKEKNSLKNANKVYLFCNSGSRSRMACESLQAQGLSNLINVTGGIIDWRKHGFPTTIGKIQVLPLQQQVQLTIGTMIWISLILSWTVDIRWAGLAGFIGAGLIVAGATGTCLLGSLLSKMPWNR